MSVRILAAAAAILATVLLVFWLYPSEEDRIRAVFADAQDAVEARKPADVMLAFTTDFTGPRGTTRETIHTALNRWLFTYQAQVELTPQPLEVRIPPDNENTATVTFHVTARVRQRDDEVWQEWQSTRELQRGMTAFLRKGDDGWAIARVELN